MRTVLAIGLLAALTACASVEPIAPERPECLQPPDQAPIDGGLGGTGNRPEDACVEEG